MKRNFCRFLITMLLPVLILTGCRRVVENHHAGVAMDTLVQTSVYQSGNQKDEDLAGSYYEQICFLEEHYFSPSMEGSDLWAVNHAGGQKASVGLLLFTLVEQCKQLGTELEGTMDITLGPVISLWNINGWAEADETEAFQVPSSDALEKAMGKTGMEQVMVNEEELTITIPEGFQLNIGAVGKGAALDAVYHSMQADERVQAASVSIGGSILTYGEKPNGTSWKIGIVNPEDTTAQVGVLELNGDWFVSTSGDYQRCVEADGVKYHHIIDPETGYPAASDVRGVTVLCKDGLRSDAFSTAFFIMGAEKSLEWLKTQTDAGAIADTYVLFVTKDGEIIMSEGMEKYFSHK